MREDACGECAIPGTCQKAIHGVGAVKTCCRGVLLVTLCTALGLSREMTGLGRKASSSSKFSGPSVDKG